MGKSYKERIEAATQKGAKKSLPPKKRSTKNASPERDLVKNELIPWFKKNGFSMSVIESKATFSQSSQKYTGSPANPGTPDLIGCDSKGMGCFVEAKAKGRLSTVRELQRIFLLEKINRGAFAIVTDSVARTESLYKGFLERDPVNRKIYLTENLPRPKNQNHPLDQSLVRNPLF